MVNIAIENLHAELGGKSVLRSINARFSQASLTGIIGPNGAGKSSLVRCMLGLLERTQGAITADDRAIETMAQREIARTMAYLPQGHMLHWPLSVERLVALGRLPHLGPLSRPGPVDHEAIQAAMRRADVLHLATRTATEISGGERARVMLARALAVGAPSLIADEPLASLDPGHQIEVMELLAGEARAGATVIAVLHDLGMAARYCDRLLLLDNGSLIAEGTPEIVLTKARLRAVYGIESHVDLTGPVPMVLPLRRSAAQPSPD